MILELSKLSIFYSIFISNPQASHFLPPKLKNNSIQDQLRELENPLKHGQQTWHGNRESCGSWIKLISKKISKKYPTKRLINTCSNFFRVTINDTCTLGFLIARLDFQRVSYFRPNRLNISQKHLESQSCPNENIKPPMLRISSHAQQHPGRVSSLEFLRWALGTGCWESRLICTAWWRYIRYPRLIAHGNEKIHDL